MKKCDRCGTELEAFTMSRMNTDDVCMDCIEVEKTHPRYKEAYDLELNEVKKGNYKYPGLFHGQKWPFGYELVTTTTWKQK